MAITREVLDQQEEAIKEIEEQLGLLTTDAIPDDEQPEIAILQNHLNLCKQIFSDLKEAYNKQQRAILEDNTDAPPAKDSMQEVLFVKNGAPNFDKKIMKEQLLGSKFEGADSKSLNKAIKVLYHEKPDPLDLDQALIDIAEIRNLKYDTAVQQYHKALQLQAAAKPKGYGVALDLGKHGGFPGSTTQLRFGKIVGDVFGLDSVFGSLISPTGGLVGPDNSSFILTDEFQYSNPDNPVVIHGVCHDAAGMLYNVWGKGPGYEYINPSSNPKKSPLAGQESGIDFWADTPEKREQISTTRKIISISDEVATVHDKANNAYKTGKKYVKKKIDDAEELYDDAVDVGKETIEDIGDGIDKGKEKVKKGINSIIDYFSDDD